MNKSEYTNSSVIYGKDYGMVYLCKSCKAYVGTHKNNPKKSLGRLANYELRMLKKEAHKYFDYLWQKGLSRGRRKYEVRNSAYTWLSHSLDIPKKYCHIGMFDIETCKKVIQLCKPYYK